MTATVVSIVGALLGGGLITGVLLHVRESPKANADAAKTIAETALSLATNLQTRLDRLENRELVWMEYVERLRAHINAGSPPPPPSFPEELKH